MAEDKKSILEEQRSQYIETMGAAQKQLEEQTGIMGKVFGAISQFFTAWIPAAGKSIAGIFPGLWEDFAAYWKASIKKDIETGVKPYIAELIAKRGMSPEIANYIMELVNRGGDFGIFVWAALLFTIFLGDVKGWMAVAMEDGNQTLRDKAKNTLPDPSAAIKAMFIDPSLEAKSRDILRRYGLSEDRIEMTIKSLRPLLDPGTIQTLFLRGEMPEEDVLSNMRALGFTDARTEAIRKTWNVIPGPQDIIRMAVREAFSPEQVSELGLDEAFPAAVSEWAGKVGLKEPWPLMFWRAHWELPSANMGFEMMHRGEIDDTQLRGLLKALDYSPVWHDRLMNIAYNVVTRVDARRLYELGVWDEEKLNGAYRKMGYSPEDADDLTAWTKVEYAHGDKEVTRSQIEQAFVKRIIERKEAHDMLTSLGWSPEKAEWILDVADFTARTAIRDETIASIKEMYLAGLSDKLQVRQRLGAEEIDPDYIEVLLERWDTTKLATRKLPSKTDLDKFLKASLIEEAEYKSELERLGYSAEMSQRYFLLNTKGA